MAERQADHDAERAEHKAAAAAAHATPKDAKPKRRAARSEPAKLSPS